MANIKSAEKRNRQRIKRRARNQFHLSTMRTLVKRVRGAVDGGNAAEAQQWLASAISTIAKTAQKGVIKKEAASRQISRLTKAVARTATATK